MDVILGFMQDVLEMAISMILIRCGIAIPANEKDQSSIYKNKNIGSNAQLKTIMMVKSIIASLYSSNQIVHSDKVKEKF